MRLMALLLLLLLFITVHSKAGTYKIRTVYDSDDRQLLEKVVVEESDPFGAEYYKTIGNAVCLIAPIAAIHLGKLEKNVVECIKTSTETVWYPYYGADARLYGNTGKLDEYIEYSALQTFGNNQVKSCVKFGDEKILNGDVGTGALIGTNIVLTAAHVFGNDDPSDYVCLFGVKNYNKKGICSNENDFTHIEVERYYRIKGYASYGTEKVKSPDTRDIAIIELDRCVENDIVPLGIVQMEPSRLKEYINDKELFTIGHPFGLPSIFCDNGCVNLDYTYDKNINYAR